MFLAFKNIIVIQIVVAIQIDVAFQIVFGQLRDLVREAIVERLKITHVMLGVETTARALPFYRPTFSDSPCMQSIPDLRSSGCRPFHARAELKWRLARASAVRVGASELVFGVEDVTATYQDLRAKGVSFMNEPRAVAGPMFAANFTDPDGHRLSIFGPEHKA